MAKRVVKAKNYERTIDECFEEFANEKRALGKSPATVSNYETTYHLFLEDTGIAPEAPITDIVLSTIYEWVGNMNLEGMRVSSQQHYVRDMRAFLNWCMEKEYLPQFKIKLPTGQEQQIKLFTDEELSLLLERPHRGDSFVVWRTYTIVNWVLATGNRAATICAVKESDINFSKSEIIIAEQKNKKAQIIPLSKDLATVLKEYIKMFDRDSEWLFSEITGAPLTTNALKQSFRKYCLDRGVQRTSIHGLRHNFAKMWVQNNGNMMVLQKLLNHSTLDTTRRYVMLFGNDLKKDFDDYNPLSTLKKSKSRTSKIERK